MTSQTLELPVSVRPTSKIRTQRTRDQWKSLVAGFATSGLTKTAFCKKQRIATSCLYRWQKVFASQPTSADFIDITKTVSSAPTAQRLADNNPQWQVELELGAGIVLRVRTG